MSTLIVDEQTMKIDAVSIDDMFLRLTLKDGRILAMPLAWSSRLQSASPGERAQWRIMPFGDAIEWEDLDEHISVKGILRGNPASQRSIG